MKEAKVNTDIILSLWLANFGPISKVSFDVFLFSIAKLCEKTDLLYEVEINLDKKLEVVLQVFKFLKNEKLEN